VGALPRERCSECLVARVVVTVERDTEYVCWAGTRVSPPPRHPRGRGTPQTSSSLLLSSLELSDTTVYEPYIRALLGTASHFCEVVVLKLRTVPIGTV